MPKDHWMHPVVVDPFLCGLWNL